MESRECWQPKDIYIVVIFGSNQKGKIQSDKHDGLGLQTKDKIIQEYINYYIAPYSILLQRLANFYGIPSENVKIFIKGEKIDFSFSELTNGKLYIQINNNEIYETIFSKDELNFNFLYKDTFKKMINSFKTKTDSKVFCFIDQSFNEISNLKMYLPILRKPHAALRMFNESCYSKSLIGIINQYFSFVLAVKRSTEDGTVDVKMLKTISKFISSIVHDGYIEKKKEEIEYAFQFIKKLCDSKIERVISDFGDTAAHYLISTADVCHNAQIISSFRNNFASIDTLFANHNLKWVYDDMEEKSDIFIKCGVNTLNDLFIFHNALNSYRNNYYENGFRKGSELLNVFNTSNLQIVERIMTYLSYSTTDQLYELITKLESEEITQDMQYELGQINLLPHNDHLIITSSNQYGESVNFRTRRIKGTNTKVVLESPAFGAFIEEVFLNVTDKPIDVENIKKAVVGNEKEGFIEYECDDESGQIQKKWTRLDIQTKAYGETSNERFFSKELLTEHPTKREILEKIGLKLVQKFDEDLTKDLSQIRKSFDKINYNLGVPLYETDDYDYYYSDDEVLTDLVQPERKIYISEEEANIILDKLHVPNSSWALDSFLFITKVLAEKTKWMEHPFDPKKEGRLDDSMYDWVWSSMKNVIPVCSISNAHSLMCRISDFLAENQIEDDLELRKDMKELLVQIGRMANDAIRVRHGERPNQ